MSMPRAGVRRGIARHKRSSQRLQRYGWNGGSSFLILNHRGQRLRSNYAE
jgi:hypothetical protein